MKRTYRTQARLLATVAGAALLLAGCGGGDEPTAVPPTAAAGPTADAPVDTPADATIVDVVATDFAFDLPPGNLSPGTYTFVLENQGGMPHDLAIEGPGVEAVTALIGPGESADVTVELEAGEYVLWCTVAGHRAQGMEVTITVG